MAKLVSSLQMFLGAEQPQNLQAPKLRHWDWGVLESSKAQNKLLFYSLHSLKGHCPGYWNFKSKHVQQQKDYHLEGKSQGTSLGTNFKRTGWDWGVLESS